MSPKLINLIKRLLTPFNIKIPISINKRSFKVLVLEGVGASHLDTSEPWMIDTLRRLLSLRPGTAFVDVGVNIGQTLLKLKSLDSDINYLGFEPNPFCVRYTRELIRANRLTNCEIVPVGLADCAGITTFIADSEADAAGSIISDLRPDKVPFRRQHIAVFRFDNIAKDLAPNNVGIIKIDVEGAELEAISGMKGFLAKHRPLVTCEVLHAHSVDQLAMVSDRNLQLVQLLGEIDYQPYRLIKDKAQSRIVELEAIDNFSESVWNDDISPALCDYLFVPREAVPETLKVFL